MLCYIDALDCIYCKKRLVVLATEWSLRLHKLVFFCCTGPVSWVSFLLVPPLFLILDDNILILPLQLLDFLDFKRHYKRTAVCFQPTCTAKCSSIWYSRGNWVHKYAIKWLRKLHFWQSEIVVQNYFLPFWLIDHLYDTMPTKPILVHHISLKWVFYAIFSWKATCLLI